MDDHVSFMIMNHASVMIMNRCELSVLFRHHESCILIHHGSSCIMHDHSSPATKGSPFMAWGWSGNKDKRETPMWGFSFVRGAPTNRPRTWIFSRLLKDINRGSIFLKFQHPLWSNIVFPVAGSVLSSFASKS